MESNILFSCEKQKKFTSEQLVIEHTLSCVVSGKIELHFANEKLVAEKGNIALIRKNELLKAIKYPDENGLPCKSINIFLTQDVLRAYVLQNKIEHQEKYFGKSIVDFTKDRFIKSYIDSLLPYIDEPDMFSHQLAQIKTNEAIELLLAGSGIMKQFLFDLSEPHKIDLEKYINQNFLFNISMSEFAKLTGRSLSTFKRDFKKVFNDTPEKWLLNRRLEEAKYLLAEKRLRPIDVYYSVGFENFSHFSNAFKQRFGVNASAIV